MAAYFRNTLEGELQLSVPLSNDESEALEELRGMSVLLIVAFLGYVARSLSDDLEGCRSSKSVFSSWLLEFDEGGGTVSSVDVAVSVPSAYDSFREALVQGMLNRDIA